MACAASANIPFVLSLRGSTLDLHGSSRGPGPIRTDPDWSRQRGSSPCPHILHCFLSATLLPTSALFPLIKVIRLACVEIMLISQQEKQPQIYTRQTAGVCSPSFPPSVSLSLSLSPSVSSHHTIFSHLGSTPPPMSDGKVV